MRSRRVLLAIVRFVLLIICLPGFFKSGVCPLEPRKMDVAMYASKSRVRKTLSFFLSHVIFIFRNIKINFCKVEIIREAFLINVVTHGGVSSFLLA